MSDDTLIGAFGEEQICRLTSLSKYQLRGWRRNGFVSPSITIKENSRSPYSFAYSFKDLLGLRVLDKLRNEHGVSLQELKKVKLELDTLGMDDWTSKRLWVHNKRVVFEEPESSKKREITSKQFVTEIPLEVVTSNARKAIRKMNKRNDKELGVVSKARQLKSSQQVFSGTRIPLKAVISYIKAGYDNKYIISEFPSLSDKDIDLARQEAA